MFALGKAGIQQYIEEARRLGLIMSTEDAEAAGTFHHELKKLSAVMKMGIVSGWCGADSHIDRYGRQNSKSHRQSN